MLQINPGWECSHCSTNNDAADIRCAACNSYKDGCKPQPTAQPTISFGGAAAAPVAALGEWKPPGGPIAFGSDERTSPVFGFDPLDSQLFATSGRITFGKSDGGLVCIGGETLATGQSTPAKGYRSPRSFCQTMETPAPRGGSPMLLGVGSAGLILRDIPDAAGKPSAGCVWTWGSGECDQLAVRTENLDDTNHRPTPIIIKAFNSPICESIAAGSMHNLAIVDHGQAVYSWGCNDEGALGRPIKNVQAEHLWRDATAPNRDRDLRIAKAPGPVWNLPIDTTVMQATAGGSHSALLTTIGDCFCWGCYRDQTGNIGFTDGTGGSASWYVRDPAEPRLGQPVPMRMPGIEGVCLELVSGENHTGVLTQKEGGRRLYLWGSTEFGQLGTEPLPVTEPNRHASLQPRAWRVDQFSFKCLDDSYRQLSISPDRDPAVPKYTLIPHPNEVELKSATLLHLYAGKYTTFFSVEVNSTVLTFGFGKNACGELGAGFAEDVMVDPVLLKSVKGLAWSAIKGGEFFTLGLTCDGSVFAWGHKEYVGLGSDIAGGEHHVLEPRLIPGLKQKVVAIEAAHRTAFALTRDGQLFGWGESSSFQIGDGLSYEDPVKRPMRVSPSSFDHGVVKAVAGGAMHSLALVKPVSEELKTDFAAKERMETIEEEQPLVAMEEEQRGKKRVREEAENVDLNEPKRARRLKEPQVNTDALPSLSRPFFPVAAMSSNPPQAPPPTPLDPRVEDSRPYSLPPMEEPGEEDTPVRLPRQLPSGQEPAAAVHFTMEETVGEEEEGEVEEDIEMEEKQSDSSSSQEEEEEEVEAIVAEEEEEEDGGSVKGEESDQGHTEAEDKDSEDEEEQEIAMEETVKEAARPRRSARAKPKEPAPKAAPKAHRASRSSKEAETQQKRRQPVSRTVKSIEIDEELPAKRVTRARNKAEPPAPPAKAKAKAKAKSSGGKKPAAVVKADKEAPVKVKEVPVKPKEVSKGTKDVPPRKDKEVPVAKPSKASAKEAKKEAVAKPKKEVTAPKRASRVVKKQESGSESEKPIADSKKAKPKAKARAARKGSVDSSEVLSQEQPASLRLRRGSKSSVESEASRQRTTRSGVKQQVADEAKRQTRARKK